MKHTLTTEEYADFLWFWNVVVPAFRESARPIILSQEPAPDESDPENEGWA